jgi:hypothetical protein
MTLIQPFLNYKAKTSFKALPMCCSKEFERLKQAIFKTLNSPPSNFKEALEAKESETTKLTNNKGTN